MPVIYETTAKIEDDGHLTIDLEDLPFEKGTQFLVKLIPKTSFNPEVFKKRMQILIDKFAQNSPYEGVSKEQIVKDLRRQREEMYYESGKN